MSAPAILSTDEAAERLGVSRRQVHNLLAAGRLEGARQLGREWAIPASAVAAYQARRKPPGRPRQAQ